MSTIDNKGAILLDGGSSLTAGGANFTGNVADVYGGATGVSSNERYDRLFMQHREHVRLGDGRPHRGLKVCI